MVIDSMYPIRATATALPSNVLNDVAEKEKIENTRPPVPCNIVWFDAVALMFVAVKGHLKRGKHSG